MTIFELEASMHLVKQSREGNPGVAVLPISVDPALLGRVDSLVSRKRFRTRSEVFQLAVAEQLERLDEETFTRECAKLDRVEERAFADMGLAADQTEWPPYYRSENAKQAEVQVPPGAGGWTVGCLGPLVSMVPLGQLTGYPINIVFDTEEPTTRPSLLSLKIMPFALYAFSVLQATPKVDSLGPMDSRIRILP